MLDLCFKWLLYGCATCTFIAVLHAANTCILSWCVQTEKATDVSQASEDWALFMEICDVINTTESGYVTGSL